jgi:hypothetical protein
MNADNEKSFPSVSIRVHPWFVFSFADFVPHRVEMPLSASLCPFVIDAGGVCCLTALRNPAQVFERLERPCRRKDRRHK